MDFCRQNFTPLEHKMMGGEGGCVCARFCKTANYLHWFNQFDRGLQTWCWKWENSPYHLARMILETTNIIVYTSLIPWRLVDLRAQCQFSHRQAAAENSAWKLRKAKGEKLKHSYLLFLEYLQEKTQPDSKCGKTRGFLHSGLLLCAEFSCLLFKVPSTARGP